MEKHSTETAWHLWAAGLGFVLAGGAAAWLNGLCHRALAGGTRWFRLASLFPAMLENAPLVLLTASFCRGAVTTSGKWEYFALVTSSLLAPALWLTADGWRRRLPRRYLAALAVPGVASTAIGTWTAVLLLAAPKKTGMEGLGAAVLFFSGLLAAGLGLLYAMAAWAAAHMSRRLRRVLDPPAW